ncbi:MAG: TenA family transcriptional regulator [Dehalococcoidia bacterium]
MGSEELRERHVALWHGAVHHPFLDGIRSGDLPESAFQTWLVQDYHFVARLLRFQALLLAQAPRADQRVLSAGLAALVAELDWFEEQAPLHSLSLQAPLQPACRAYTDFLIALTHEPYPAGITALWAVERAYLDAWAGVRPGAPAFREYVDHWTTDAFVMYVEEIAEATDRSLKLASADQMAQADGAFAWTARYERDFWQMAFAPLRSASTPPLRRASA